MTDLKKEIQDNEVLVIVCGEDYQEKLVKVIKETGKQFKKICYITLNKPYNNLIEIFKKNRIGVKGFFFIDAITSTVIKPSSIKNCIFVRSPNALTEMNIAISKVREILDPDLFIFDSLSSLLIYEKGSVLIKFVHSIINSLRIHKTKAVFIILEEDYETTFKKDLEMFADKILKS